MDKLLQSLLREWDYLLQLQDETLAGNKALYRRYEGAHSAYLALCERASLLCGAHTALRLLLTLL